MGQARPGLAPVVTPDRETTTRWTAGDHEPVLGGMMTGSSASTGNGNTKYDAAADFVLPDLAGAGGRVERPTAGQLGPRRDI